MYCKNIVFLDIEVANNKPVDIGAIKSTGEELHTHSLNSFDSFLRGENTVCGHNIFNHDLLYLKNIIEKNHITQFIDTLYWSPLLFPEKPYHKLVKDDKLCSDELNNPLNDAKKAYHLFNDEIGAFHELDKDLQDIYYGLLSGQREFAGFFNFIGYQSKINVESSIREYFKGRICSNAPVASITGKYPVELAYALSQITVITHDSLTPAWVLKNYPRVENILHYLRNRKCIEGCAYCNESLDEIKGLNKYFHYPSFRLYDGEPLQQNAANAAIAGKSILAIFPTGGGKSVTFQLPALMAGENEKGLTVVLSPLQSLMKDQTDNLERQHGITEAVTINGSLDPVERAKAFERVEDGSAALLYISPESLRSKSIERLLLKRNVVRFVIDEAHCFSAWGQDFRTDYLYVGEFIKTLQEAKNMPQNIPVSCFTATAKQNVVNDICKYFKDKLSVDLEIFRAGSARKNLTYHIFHEENDDSKYLKLRQLIDDNDCPAIVYVSRTRKAEDLAKHLTEDGYPALPYHGKMDKQIRIANQDAFMNGAVKIIVATTAFGMGVDKKDVGMVVHCDISDSLENYVQEAGRAGRDEKLQADCFVLFNDEDLNKHFNMLNQTKISQKEIRQVWKSIKNLTKNREHFSKSALEIAREAGWDDAVSDMETRIKTAINALEQSGFVKRGQNMPRIFANSILVKNMEEARLKIDNSPRLDNKSREQAIRIISTLMGARSKKERTTDEGEDRIDYISDRLGIEIKDVVRIVSVLREEKLLADNKDLIAYIKKKENNNRSKQILLLHRKIEDFLCEYIVETEQTINIKELNEKLFAKVPKSSIINLKTVLNYWSIKRIIKKIPENNKNCISLKPCFSLAEMKMKIDKRAKIANNIIDFLYQKIAADLKQGEQDEAPVYFSVLELKDNFEKSLFGEKTNIEEIEDALYYLIKIESLKIEGGFLVIYNAMRIERLEHDSKAQYKKEHYGELEQYYENRMQQIHIVGEYAKRMAEDYRSAMEFVNDYFIMNYDLFLHKYFRGRKEEISKNITPKKFRQLFGELSPTQLKIINNQTDKTIVVAAGPGSGKTKLLVHKLASLYMMEDVKHEQMLMLTFSRAAATEFKKRLMTLIGNAANFIQITTFHSYCFDLLGKVGDLEKSDKIIEQTIEKIRNKEVDRTRLTKTVLVIDEAQDMSAAEYALVLALKERNDDIRIIAVGDDDQNIYEFRGSSSKYLETLIKEENAKSYELVENFRSCANIVDFANLFANKISHRIKTTPIQPVKSENGIVSVTNLYTDNMVIPTVNLLLKESLPGITAILTRTNADAFNIAGLLNNHKINAKLIQTNNDFSLYNLVEFRDFIADIERDNENYSISEDAWLKAKKNLCKKYSTSSDLEGVCKLIRDFEEVNNKTKYKSDFKQFVRESKLEDMTDSLQNSILVSTIHQAKGREFDNVILSLSRYQNLEDSQLRTIYVALTRAKKNLYILYNGNYFDRIKVNNCYKYQDNSAYPQSEKLLLSLSHKDIWLDFFADKQQEIDSLRSGQVLTVSNNTLIYGNKEVGKFSKKCIAQIEKLKANAYVPSLSTVRHIVWWQGDEMDKEIKIILPNVEFQRKK